MRRASARILQSAMVAVLLTASACGQGDGPVAVLPATSEEPEAAMASNPLGEPSPVVEESKETPLRSTPEGLLRSILLGRERVDLPYLARCESLTAGKEQIDKMDEARAWRNYCMKSVQPLWTKIEAAVETGRARFTIEGDQATAALDVGGSIGEMDLRFVRIDGEWYLENREQE